MVLVGISGLLFGCHRGGKVHISDTPAPIENPKKLHPFDSTRGCFSDAIVNGSTVNNTNPLKNHVVMILSRFTKNPKDTEVLTSLCTGTLIAPNTVLTAAHCFPQNLISTQIIASINLYCSSGFSKNLVYQARKVSIYPEYNIRDTPSVLSPDHDIATVQFEGILPAEYFPIPFNKIDVREEMMNTSSQMIMIGYGRTKTIDDSLPELRYVTRSWDRLVLTKDSFSLIEKQNLIGINQTDARGGCSGDSGGPLLISDHGQLKILGVASYIESQSESALCEQGHIYYSYVPAYWDWISRQIQ